MHKDRHLTRSAIYLILQQGDKTLCIRRHNTGYRDGEYTLPAGHVEADETFTETCIREAKEEICVIIKETDLKLVHVMQRYEEDVYVTDYYFMVRQWEGEPVIGEPDRADDIAWLAPEGVAKQA
ncbi:NUDIX hydrolase, partial [Candidatus Saccharibacteria bacterium]